MLTIPVITGPTASGKSDLVFSLAQALHTEIISSDSIQVYQGFNIGSAKPLPELLASVKHHFVDIINYSETYSVAMYQKMAIQTIDRMIMHGKIPVISGGTGLYLRSVIGSDHYSEVLPNEEFRATCNQESIRKGPAWLHERLQEIDPEKANKLHPNDKRRIIRALEIFEFSGNQMSDKKDQNPSMQRFLPKLFGLHWERNDLYQRIEQRVEQMFKDGFIDEVENLRFIGVNEESTPMKSIGYKQVNQFLKGVISYEVMVEVIKKETRNYAKRQLTWNRNQFDVIWLDPHEGVVKNIQRIIAAIK